MHIEEHLVEVLLIVEGILRFEKLIKLINRLIETFNALILHIYSKFIMRVFVRTATANTCRVNYMIFIRFRNYRGGYFNNLS
jgi:hypothetical protein